MTSEAGYQLGNCSSVSSFSDKKVNFSHSLIGVGAVVVRVSVYPGHS